jgi:hypothetical protein
LNVRKVIMEEFQNASNIFNFLRLVNRDDIESFDGPFYRFEVFGTEYLPGSDGLSVKKSGALPAFGEDFFHERRFSDLSRPVKNDCFSGKE